MSCSWPSVLLSELLVHHKTYISEPEARTYPKLSVRLYGRGVVPDDPVDGAQLKMKRHQIANAGQVILSEIWGKKGAIGIVPPEGEGALCTSHFFLFHVVEDKVIRRWLHWVFAANYLEPQLSAGAKGSTGYAAVRPKHLLEATIPFPPLPEQQRLAVKLDALHQRIEEGQRLQEELDSEVADLRQAIVRGFFEDAASRFPTRPLGSLFMYRSQLIRPGNQRTEPLRFVGLQHVEPHTGNRLGEDTLNPQKLAGRKFLFQKGDILYGYLRPYLNKVWYAEFDGACAVDQWVLIRNASFVSAAYLCALLRSPIVLEPAVRSTNPLTLPRLSSGVFENIEVPVPDSLPAQEEFVAALDERVNTVQVVRDIQNSRGAEIDELMPAILDQAFKGEL